MYDIYRCIVQYLKDRERGRRAVELFESLDVDRDGFLSADELRKLGLERLEEARFAAK